MTLDTEFSCFEECGKREHGKLLHLDGPETVLRKCVSDQSLDPAVEIRESPRRNDAE